VRKFTVEDPSICEINEDGELLGKHIGKTTLMLQMDYNNNGQIIKLATKSI